MVFKTKPAGHVPAFFAHKNQALFPFCPPSVWASRLRRTALAGRSAKNTSLAANEAPALRSTRGRGHCARCIVLPRGSLCGRRSRPGCPVLRRYEPRDCGRRVWFLLVVGREAGRGFLALDNGWRRYVGQWN